MLIAIAAIALTVACQRPQVDSSDAPETAANPAPTAAPITLNGTGASFPLFLYERIFGEYRQTVDPNLLINYQPTGSAAGIQQMISQTVDFGASDVAMTDDEIAQVEPGVVLIPMTAGTVAIAYNLPGVESGLKLTRTALVNIFLGQLTQWNAPEIAAANPEVTLPDLPITLVHRSDGSGTTAVLTAHLSAISPDWDAQVGTGLNVNWPAGVGIKANAGVSAQIQQAEGAIGYVEYSYANQLGLPIAALENQAGQFVEPSPAAGAKGLAAVTMPENLKVFVTDPADPEAYPIVTYSWILAYQQYEEAAKGEALKAVLKWGLSEGQQFSEQLGYIPLPSAVVEQAAAAVDSIQTP
ncbi:MAG: phosphate ABC transporter substrate-binding protein PstS [Leptolyngbya sp. SIO1E4]|nr:phosphate ABC transporter substrate-binding protein PstS [Leptolyngbya sp. SIO1E4]